MNTVKIAAATAFLLLSCTAFSMPDIYQGTLRVEGKKLVLTRCDLVKNKYTLVDKKGKNASLLAKLPKEINDTDTKISATVIAEYNEKNGENYLIVQEIDEVKVGASCHLVD